MAVQIVGDGFGAKFNALLDECSNQLLIVSPFIGRTVASSLADHLERSEGLHVRSSPDSIVRISLRVLVVYMVQNNCSTQAQNCMRYKIFIPSCISSIRTPLLRDHLTSPLTVSIRIMSSASLWRTSWHSRRNARTTSMDYSPASKLQEIG